VIGSPLEALGGAVIAIPVAIVLLSVLIVVHEAGHYLAARRVGIEVLEFGLGYPPRILGRSWRGTVFTLNAIPFGGFARMRGESGDAAEPGSFVSKSRRARAFVLIAGPLMNLLAAPLLFAGAALIADLDGVEITRVEAGTPAATSGLLVGDVIRTVDGIDVPMPPDVGAAIRDRVGTEVRLGIERDGEFRNVMTTPRITYPDDQGPLGVGINLHLAPRPPLEALVSGFKRTAESIVLLPGLIVETARSDEGLQVAGPVGIVEMVGQAARQGPEVVLFLAALLSTQLALFNLLPWPVLDGGRLVLIGVEAVRGKPMSVEREGAINFVGIALLLLLAALVTVGDIQRIAGG
jgi:regulator of sigma E protease